MMKPYKLLLIGLSLLAIATACSDFLEERSQNMAYVETINDLDELLVGEVYFGRDANGGQDPQGYPPHSKGWTSIASSRFISHFLMDDDIEEFACGPNPYMDQSGVPYTVNTWSDYYARIAAANSILFQMTEMERTQNDTLFPRVEGEARFLRAAYYFMLVNTYGQPYSVETADEDLGVPVKTSGEIEDRFFARNTVAEVYAQITEDLERAMECLRDVTPFARPIRTNYAAAAALLSRVYLYMEEYEKAVAVADSAINYPGFDILDLNTFTQGESFASLSSSETLFSQRGTFMAWLQPDDSLNTGQAWAPVVTAVGNSYSVSQDLLACYADGDLRKEVFFVPRRIIDTTYRCLKVRELSDDVVGEDHVIRLPEVYLNKAEALAILGRDGEAQNTLQELLRRRYVSGSVPTVTASGEELVNYIRDERRRELCYEGHRWFDLRRYAVNSKYPYTKAIEHEAYEWVQTSETTGYFRKAGKYVLKPYPEDKEAYVLPLPDYAVLFNEGVLEQNPTRPERSIQPL